MGFASYSKYVLFQTHETGYFYNGYTRSVWVEENVFYDVLKKISSGFVGNWTGRFRKRNDNTSYETNKASVQNKKQRGKKITISLSGETDWAFVFPSIRCMTKIANFVFVRTTAVKNNAHFSFRMRQQSPCSIFIKTAPSFVRMHFRSPQLKLKRLASREGY